ncbi:hypothetical protein [Enhygromyxa salina]|nr:hypothetical protein [Enhygromyxa salina]
MVDTPYPILQEDVYIFIGGISTEPELVDIINEHRTALYETQKWWKQDEIANMLYHSQLAWGVPIMIRMWHLISTGSSPREAGIVSNGISRLIESAENKIPKVKNDYSWDNEGYKTGRHRTIEAWMMLQAWRKLMDRIGDVHAPIMFGAVFDTATMARTVGQQPIPDRWTYETVTGADCSNWHAKDKHRREQPLQIAGEIARFLAEDAHRYQPGKRYFLGHEVPQVIDPRAVDLMNEAIAYFEAEIQAMDRQHLIDAGILEDDDDDDDDDDGFDSYFWSDLDNWRASPNGSFWQRIAHIAHNAVLGDFHRLVDATITAVELIDDEYADLLAARLLADAGPSDQLRRLVTLAKQRPEPRWIELCLIALSDSGLAWALEAAGELMCRLDPDATRFGPPWLPLWRRLVPKLDMQLFKLFRSQNLTAVHERIRSITAVHPPDTVLWAGQPLHLRRLAAQLERSVGKDPQAPAEVAALRHLLETMTGVDLARLWASPEAVAPAHAGPLLAALRADPSFAAHQPGTRLFFGTLVPQA